MPRTAAPLLTRTPGEMVQPLGWRSVARNRHPCSGSEVTRPLGDSICSSVKWGLCSPSRIWKGQKVSGCEDSHKHNTALLSVPLLPVMTVEQKPGLILTGVSHACRLWPVCPCLRTQAFLGL